MKRCIIFYCLATPVLFYTKVSLADSIKPIKKRYYEKIKINKVIKNNSFDSKKNNNPMLKPRINRITQLANTYTKHACVKTLDTKIRLTEKLSAKVHELERQVQRSEIDRKFKYFETKRQARYCKETAILIGISVIGLSFLTGGIALGFAAGAGVLLASKILSMIGISTLLTEASALCVQYMRECGFYKSKLEIYAKEKICNCIKKPTIIKKVKFASSSTKKWWKKNI
jgi:hypothetical protein